MHAAEGVEACLLFCKALVFLFIPAISASACITTPHTPRYHHYNPDRTRTSPVRRYAILIIIFSPLPALSTMYEYYIVVGYNMDGSQRHAVPANLEQRSTGLLGAGSTESLRRSPPPLLHVGGPVQGGYVLMDAGTGRDQVRTGGLCEE